MGWARKATLQPSYQQERDPVPIVREFGWTQYQSEQVQKILSQLQLEPWTVQPIVSHYTD